MGVDPQTGAAAALLPNLQSTIEEDEDDEEASPAKPLLSLDADSVLHGMTVGNVGAGADAAAGAEDLNTLQSTPPMLSTSGRTSPPPIGLREGAISPARISRRTTNSGAPVMKKE